MAARPAEQARHDLRVDHRSAGGHPAHGVGQVVEPRHALLEQVADPGRVLADEVDRVARLDVLRQHEDGDLGLRPADVPRGLEALRRVRRRHPHVDDRDVRSLAVDEREQPGNVLGLADDPEARRLERGRQRLAEQDGVVCQDDPDRPRPVSSRGAPGSCASDGEWRKRIESTMR